MQHHADAIPDQQNIAMRIRDLGDGGGVGGQANQGIAAFSVTNISGA
jgi:hypothetical protein